MQDVKKARIKDAWDCKFNKFILELWFQICDSDANTVYIHAIFKW